MALDRTQPCSGLKVHLPFQWVGWNPEHFHIWKTEKGSDGNNWLSRSRSRAAVNNLPCVTEYFVCVWLKGANVADKLGASPAQCVLPLPRLLRREAAFPKNTYRRQIGFFVVVPVVTLEVPCAVAPAPPPSSFRLHLIAQQVCIFWLLPRLLQQDQPHMWAVFSTVDIPQ